MRKSMLLLIVALSVPLLAQPARYMVATKRPARTARIPLVQDVEQSREHDVRAFQTFDGFAATLTDEEVAELRRSPDVAFVTRVVERHILDGMPPRRLMPELSARYQTAQTVPYGIDLVKARDLWSMTRGEGINVAVVDTGIDLEHPDLKPVYAGGHTSVPNTTSNADGHQHGTHVAGTIAAIDNGFGVVGVAPGVKIWAVKALADNGYGSDESLSAGVDWVIQKKREVGGRWIMNLSIGSNESSPLEKIAFQRAADEGILLIAAAGNRNAPTVDYPAQYTHVLAVGAVDERQTKASFSSFGQGLAVMAPGVRVLSSVPKGKFALADIEITSSNWLSPWQIEGTALKEVTAPIVSCGLGKAGDFPANVAGKICLIQRGEIYFRDKAKNAKEAGAAAVIIHNETDAQEASGDWRTWTLYPAVCGETRTQLCYPEDLNYDFGLVLALPRDGGRTLEQQFGNTITARYERVDYSLLSGTSMAAPHTVGVAALLWALDPNATPAEIKHALKMSATDLGFKGFDELYGYGLIDAVAAAKWLVPEKFGLPPHTGTTRRRSQGH